MNEIDVSKCKYYSKDGTCSSLNEDCTKCVHNYCDWKVNQKQLQKLKADNRELCNAIENELHEQYERCVNSAESDILWGVLDKNATEAQFCKGVIYSTRNYIARLKAENEELKEKLELANEDIRTECTRCALTNKLEQCLDEIKDICKSTICDYPMSKVEEILQKIKEVKE